MSLDAYRQNRQLAEEALRRFAQDAEKFEGRLVDRITEQLAELDTKAGDLVPSDRNINRIAEVVAGLRAGMMDEEWAEAVNRYLDVYDDVEQGLVQHAETLGGVDRDVLTALRRQYARATTEFLLNDQTYAKSLLMPLQEALSTNISTGAPLKDLVRAVRALARSTEDSQGAIQAAVQGPAERAATLYERTASQKVAEAVNADIFYYQGRNIDTTRPFCKERAGHAWHRREIEEWGRMAKDGDGWAGMVDGTDEKTIFVYLGGWYGERNTCRHVLVPIDIGDAPAEDVARMQARGFLSGTAVPTRPKEKEQPQEPAKPKPKAKPKTVKSAFLTSGSKEYDKTYTKLLADQDGAAELTQKYRTLHGLLRPGETLDTPRVKETTQKVNPYFHETTRDVLGKNMGVARRDKGLVLIRLQDGHSVVARGYDAEAEEFQSSPGEWAAKHGNKSGTGGFTGVDDSGRIYVADQYRGMIVNGKPQMWSISTMGRVVDKNVVATVTHEMAHLIAFEHDPAVGVGRAVAPRKLSALAAEKGVNLEDAPTLYGSYNWDEFWAESFAAYVHMPKWFESNYPKAHGLFIEALAAYGIDRKTIKQHK